MRRKLFYNINHFITFFPETIDWQQSNSHCCEQKNENYMYLGPLISVIHSFFYKMFADYNLEKTK